jgi:tetratricopeptide (TPR) repeat protein
MADAQHLEAAASGASARHAACLRAGRRLAEAGHAEAARRFLEKALRYAPDDPRARAALGSLFAQLGLSARAATLLQAALGSDDESTEATSAPERGRALVDLAKVMAESLDDLPRAIARLRQVSARAPEAAEARALEAEYCERLGDLAGASHAYARLREAAELGWARGQVVVRALGRGARFEENHGDVAMAERHLRVALGQAPHDSVLAEEYRRLAALSFGERASHKS